MWIVSFLDFINHRKHPWVYQGQISLPKWILLQESGSSECEQWETHMGLFEREAGRHWYVHIAGKVRAKEWERTPTLWCKGHGRVKPGSARPPDPPSLWCHSLQDMGLQGGSVWRSPRTGPKPRSQRDSGTGLCPQRKCTWLWVGLGERSHTGSMGREGWDKNKQTGGDT